MGEVVSALTIAGTDPTGGAGIQADLKTFQECEVYGMSVLTSAVAQNTQGVRAVEHMPIPFIESQLQAVYDDIIPGALKSGMISSVDMMELVAGYVKKYPNIPYVIDPVMVATSGDVLMDKKSRQIIRNLLLPLATVVTPNIPEAEILVGFSICKREEMEKAAQTIVEQFGAQVAIVKGGHVLGKAIDVMYDGAQFYYLEAERIDTKHTHGTGCTFSAVITAELAKGHPAKVAAERAKGFITDALRYPLNIGKGQGPTNHWGYRLKGLPNQEVK